MSRKAQLWADEQMYQAMVTVMQQSGTHTAAVRDAASALWRALQEEAEREIGS